jgi:hypothetical protein
MKSEWTIEIKMAPGAAVCAGVWCVVVVLSCVISSYLFAKYNWKKSSVWTWKWINGRRELGAWAALVKELIEEDQTSSRNHVRMPIAVCRAAADVGVQSTKMWNCLRNADNGKDKSRADITIRSQWR